MWNLGGVVVAGVVVVGVVVVDEVVERPKPTPRATPVNNIRIANDSVAILFTEK